MSVVHNVNKSSKISKHYWQIGERNSQTFSCRQYNEIRLSKVTFVVYRLIDFQTSLNLRDSIDNWNKGTNLWLRSIMYERASRNKVMYTYALSALWHGFYPGYYLTFASGAFFTVASRSVSTHERCVVFKEYERIKLLIFNLPYSCNRSVAIFDRCSWNLNERRLFTMS